MKFCNYPRPNMDRSAFRPTPCCQQLRPAGSSAPSGRPSGFVLRSDGSCLLGGETIISYFYRLFSCFHQTTVKSPLLAFIYCFLLSFLFTQFAGPGKRHFSSYAGRRASPRAFGRHPNHKPRREQRKRHHRSLRPCAILLSTANPAISSTGTQGGVPANFHTRHHRRST